jgi:hypothetical protein
VEYLQICPVSLASEVIAERWTPLIPARDRSVPTAITSVEIQHGSADISQSLLAQRLRTLEAAGVIERRPNPVRARLGIPPNTGRQGAGDGTKRAGHLAQHWVELKQEHSTTRPT